jgi:glycosyltransferase involved in cell wall biosynthesis
MVIPLDMVYFVYEYPPYIVGGLGTYAGYLTRELIRLGHDVTVLAMHTSNTPTRDIHKGVEVHRPIVQNIDINLLLPMFIPEEIRRWSKDGQKYFGDMFLYNVLSASKLVNDLVRTEHRAVDVISCHDWLGSIGGILASKGLNKPMVFHVHSTEHGRAGNGSQVVKRLERLAADSAERVVTVSDAMRDHLVQLGFEERKIRVIYNGIDTERYAISRFTPQILKDVRQELGVSQNELLIFFIGRLNWVKGADMLVQAMPQIVQSIPQAKLLLVGIGDQQEMLKQDVARLGLTDNVILKYEFLDEEQKIKYYAAADVCVFPSKYEPFGIVCTEAMALSKPVVVGARGISGFREQIISSGPNQCGFHIDPYNPADIAEYLIKLLADKTLRVKLGHNARKRVEEVFNWPKIAEDTIRVYNEVVSQS